LIKTSWGKGGGAKGLVKKTGGTKKGFPRCVRLAKSWRADLGGKGGAQGGFRGKSKHIIDGER